MKCLTPYQAGICNLQLSWWLHWSRLEFIYTNKGGIRIETSILQPSEEEKMTDTFTGTELNPTNRTETSGGTWEYSGIAQHICTLQRLRSSGRSPSTFFTEWTVDMHSLSKIGTSICVGFAVDEGKLHLEDHFLIMWEKSCRRRMMKHCEDITIYDLLTMQAGSK